MKKEFDPFFHKEETEYKELSWRVTIGDDFSSHTYEFKAADELSIQMIYALLIAALRMTGFKK